VEPTTDGRALMLMLSSAVASPAGRLFAWLLAVILVLTAGAEETGKWSRGDKWDTKEERSCRKGRRRGVERSRDEGRSRRKR
jgi:hypothetical protein